MYNQQERRSILIESKHTDSKRRRGVILTAQALEKLQLAKLETETKENNGIVYTLEALSDRTGLDSHTLAKVFMSNSKVDRRTLSRCFKAFNLFLDPSDYYQPTIGVQKLAAESTTTIENQTEISQNRQEWDGAPDVSFFSGRIAELVTLKQWIQSEHCRMIMLWGIGGVGKTWLATKLAKLIKDEFDIVLWRSLRNVPHIDDTLTDLIQLLSSEQVTDLPRTVDHKISLLISHLRASRCLLILDNSETILQGYTQQPKISDCLAGKYRQDYQDYGQLLRIIGETSHQSCLLITSREKPRGIERLEGNKLPVRIMKLKGLPIEEAKQILQHKGVFQGSKQDYSQLIAYYRGNPLILKLVATTIQNLFAGNIRKFLNQNTPIFGDICTLLDRQFERLSNAEKNLIGCLATQEQPISVAELRLKLKSQMSAKTILEILESLSARSLLEQKNGSFFLEPLLKDYVTM